MSRPHRDSRAWCRPFTGLDLTSAAKLGLVVCFGVALVVTGAGRAYAFVAGVPGRVTVVECHFESGDKRDGWACRGAFTADDGSVRIDRVRIHPLLRDRPTGPVPVKVTGPGASSAWEPDPWSLLPAGAGVSVLVFCAAGFWWIGRPDREEAARLAASRAEMDRVRREVAKLRAELDDLRHDPGPDPPPPTP
ncbi:hypothetical protein [Micromonospora sp. NPDC004704]